MQKFMRDNLKQKGLHCTTITFILKNQNQTQRSFVSIHPRSQNTVRKLS